MNTMKVGLVTDSTADIPAVLVEKHHIHVIPAIINISGKSFEDGVNISRDEFYARLPSLPMPPTTAAPSVGSFQEQYENLFKNGAERIISVHPPHSLSGILNAARLAAESFAGRVHVFDSGQISLGAGFQVLLAAEALASGAGLDEVLRMLARLYDRVRVIALLDSLEYLRRSGRVSWARAKVGGLLNLKPLIELRYGLVKRLGQTRTRLQGIKRLLESARSWGPLERLAVLHSNAEKDAHQLLDEFKPRLSDAPLLVNVTTIIGTHVGPNGLGFAAVTA